MIERQISRLSEVSDADRSQMRLNAERALTSGNTKRAEDAAMLIAAIDAFDAQQKEARLATYGDMTVAARIIEAFEKKPMSESERKMVQALIDHPDASSNHLSSVCGWRESAWHLHFGTMCSNRFAHQLPPPPSEVRDAFFYSGILADFNDDSRGFTMKPEALAAFTSMGFKKSPR